jgi:diguanylate cyclase (GGDEF)-like protein
MPGIGQVSPEIRYAAVFDKVSQANYLGALLVVDADGWVVMDSRSSVAATINVADREHFRALKSGPAFGLKIGRPVNSRVKSGAIITLSRRLDDADGRFAGAVLGGMRLDYFQELFAQFNLGARGSITLFRDDGRVIARYPPRPSEIDRDDSHTTSFRLISNALSGQFVGTAASDGITRLETFRHIGDLPLILRVGIAVDDIDAAWRGKATIIGAILLALLAGGLWLGLLVTREMRRRMAAEAALADAAARMAVMAATDALTGIANRRTFNASLAREWRRMAREAAPIALLLIDVDSFKLFNDRYGHPEGDRALIAVAACIDQCARRPGDHAARFGGEEFVVVLPNTTAADAERVAERIRTAVLAREIAHADGPAGRLSISIGVAVARPTPDENETALLARADQALYEAKRAGRNRVMRDIDSLSPAAGVTT